MKADLIKGLVLAVFAGWLIYFLINQKRQAVWLSIRKIGYFHLVVGVFLWSVSRVLFPVYEASFTLALALAVLAITKQREHRVSAGILLALSVGAVSWSSSVYFDWPPTKNSNLKSGIEGIRLSRLSDEKNRHAIEINECFYYVYGWQEGLTLYRFKAPPETIEMMTKRLGLSETDARAHEWATASRYLFRNHPPYWWQPKTLKPTKFYWRAYPGQRALIYDEDSKQAYLCEGPG